MTHPAFRLINDPAPAAIHPGSQLEVVIEYRGIKKEPHPCRLVVHSSDPVRPEIMVDVIAHTRLGRLPGRMRRSVPATRAAHAADAADAADAAAAPTGTAVTSATTAATSEHVH